jgi:hypothetical protein
MNFLGEVPPHFRVSFIGVSHSGKGRAILLCDPLVEFVLTFCPVHVYS